MSSRLANVLSRTLCVQRGRRIGHALIPNGNAKWMYASAPIPLRQPDRYGSPDGNLTHMYGTPDGNLAHGP